MENEVIPVAEAGRAAGIDALRPFVIGTSPPSLSAIRALGRIGNEAAVSLLLPLPKQPEPASKPLPPMPWLWQNISPLPRPSPRSETLQEAPPRYRERVVRALGKSAAPSKKSDPPDGHFKIHILTCGPKQELLSASMAVAASP
ncbi:MAG: hypothetical protein R3C68_08705 [Myxococcota bacterium]